MRPEIRNEHPERQIVTVRVFNAPRETVFSAWTNPELLKQWWGPKGFTNTFHQFNLRTGGHWKFTMHGPDGGNYPNESVFVEIKKPERIVLNHVSKPVFQLTAHFEEVDHNKTELTFEQLFPTIKEYNKVKGFAIDANEENMDRLADVLQNMKSRTHL
ncbi:MAG: SRPBCC family protein [Flavisolibacter sp.]|nr:SRPBCC family protein [Flavisolibacter sp.]